MSLSKSEIKETVSTLRDRLKHGQNMTKILESQLDTAQQNISLLQGQVRLANETILNLKKYFQETENTLNELLVPNHQSSRKFHYDNIPKENDVEPPQKNLPNIETNYRSPRTPESSESKHHEDKREHNNKSPYAQQLRQVLDVLQDEEPRKSAHHSDKDCSCQDCHPHPPQRSTSSKQYHEAEHYPRKSSSDGEYSKPKHKMNGHINSHEQISPKPAFYRNHGESSHGHHSSYSNHCMGPCCQIESPGGYKVMEKSSHYIESEKSSHYIEKSPGGGVHYIAVHSPDGSSKHAERHHGHHVNYVPYAYHMVENPHKSMHEVVPPMSPSARRKRAYMPMVPNEEPPHLKYTKVKRIDGSKLTAQKVLQDFTKRRFISYNPRYDLDLLIVPPPIPASDLLKGSNIAKMKQFAAFAAAASPPNTSESLNVNNGQQDSRPEMYPDTESISPRNDNEEVFIDDGKLSDGNNNSKAYNNDNENNDTNNNNNNNEKTVNWSPKQSVFANKGVGVLPSIKEEPRSKLEDQISKLRNENGENVKSVPSYLQKSNSPYNDTNNNTDSPNNSLMHERGSPSATTLVNRRTEQYCN